MSDKARYLYSATTLATSFLILMGLTSSYLAFDFVSVGLSGISNYINYEDVKGEVYSSFSSFESFACRKSRNNEILTVCGNIFTFELSGLIFKVAITVSVVLNLVVTYLVFHQKLVSFFPYLSPVIYFIGSFCYLAMNSGTILDPNDKEVTLNYEKGVFLIFMVNLLNVLVCVYFYYYSKLENLDFASLVEGFATGEAGKGPDVSDKETKVSSVVLELLSQSISALESTQPQHPSTLNDKILESLRLQISALSKLSSPDKYKVADEIESTKRFSSQVSMGRSQDDRSLALTNVDRLANENQDLRLELSRITVRNESFVEENERQKKILDNHNRLLTDKQLKIEELERGKKALEAKERSLADSNAELKKFVKDYEDLLIQLKKDKDEAVKAALNKDKEIDLLSTQILTIKTESDALKTVMTPGSLSERSFGDIQLESLSGQLNVLNEVIKNEKTEKLELLGRVKTLQGLNKDLDLKLKAAIDDYQKSLEQVYQLEEKLKQQQDLSVSSDSASQSSRTKLRQRNQELEAKLEKISESGNSSFKILKQAEDEFDRVKQELIHNSAQQAREIEVLQARLKSQENFFEKELQTTQLALESTKDDVKKMNLQVEFYKSEINRLEEIGQQLEASLSESHPELKQKLSDNSKKSSQNLQDLSEKIDSILREKEKLRKKLLKTEQELQLVSEECQNLHKLKFEGKKDSQVSLGSIESSSKSIQDSLILEGISPSIVFHNPLIEKLSQLRKEPAMIYSSVWKNLEQMVVEKLKRDKKDIDLGKDPQNVADYVFEFMQSQYGLKSLGLKQLKALIVSLEELYRIQHPYATFFCRVLGVFHPRPIPSKVAVGLFAALAQFNSITRRQSVKTENFSDLYETLQFGGEASISAVIGLVKKVFADRREAGERVLSNLHRDQPDSFELKVLIICAQLLSAGRSDESLFTKPAMDYSEFIDHLRLQVWVCQEEAENLCRVLDEAGLGEVTQASWQGKVHFDEFCSKLDSKPAMVSKADFLNSLVIEHEFEVLEDYHMLRQIVVKGNPITAQLTSHYLLQIDANLGLDFQERVFKEALVYDGGHGREVSSESLCIVILKHNIGGYGKGLFFLNTLSS